MPFCVDIIYYLTCNMKELDLVRSRSKQGEDEIISGVSSLIQPHACSFCKTLALKTPSGYVKDRWGTKKQTQKDLLQGTSAASVISLLLCNCCSRVNSFTLTNYEHASHWPRNFIMKINSFVAM